MLLLNARRHIEDLDRSIRRFLESHPVSSETVFDASTGDLVVRAIVERLPPWQLTAMASDAIHNLRAPLDHMWSRVVSSTGEMDPRGSNFRFYQSQEEFLKRHKSVKSSHRDLIKALREISPFRGGNSLLWALHELDNRRKHFDLNPVMGSVSRSTINAAGLGGWSGMQGPSKLPSIPLRINAGTPISPVTTGAELFRFRNVSRETAEASYVHSEFRIVLGDVESVPEVRGRGITGLLRSIETEVQRVVSTFRALRPGRLEEPTDAVREQNDA